MCFGDSMLRILCCKYTIRRSFTSKKNTKLEYKTIKAEKLRKNDRDFSIY
jgi:hypothetical protein